MDQTNALKTNLWVDVHQGETGCVEHHKPVDGEKQVPEVKENLRRGHRGQRIHGRAQREPGEKDY